MFKLPAADKDCNVLLEKKKETYMTLRKLWEKIHYNALMACYRYERFQC